MTTAGPLSGDGRLRARVARRCRATAVVLRRLLGAVLLGVATLLLMKPEPHQHWSEPPVVRPIAVVDHAVSPGEGTGGPESPA
jgi:hypothetical protein